MKKLEGLTEEIKEALKVPLEHAAPNSVSIGDLRRIDKICAILEQAKDSAEYEDTDFNFLKSKFESFKDWQSHPDVRKLVIAAAEILGV